MEVNMKENKGEHPFGDVGQLISLGVFLVVWVGDSFFLRKSTFLSDYVPFSIRLSFLSLTLIAAMYLFRSGHVVVSHERRPNSVVASGAFRYVRHPLYLASILTYLGLTVSTVSLFSLVLFVGIFVFHNYIASYEEKLLDARFGEEYRKYKRRTGKWMPKIGKKSLTKEKEIRV
jgi:protein-S-isoprenylcysteine O-methyltransferase Ste14